MGLVEGLKLRFAYDDDRGRSKLAIVKRRDRHRGVVYFTSEHCRYILYFDYLFSSCYTMVSL